MNLLGIFTRKPNTDRELIETRTENLFLKDRAEAAVNLAVEVGIRNAVLEDEASRLRRPQRERRKDAGSIVASRNATTKFYADKCEALTPEQRSEALSRALTERMR